MATLVKNQLGIWTLHQTGTVSELISEASALINQSHGGDVRIIPTEDEAKVLGQSADVPPARWFDVEGNLRVG